MTRIVVCEDERIVALDLRAFLQKNGFEVPALYASAEELLLDVEKLRPDLVMMDIHLQGEMDGIEAGAILFERWAIPVIFLTAYADGPTIDRASLTHPYAYILKPYDERELKTAIAIGLYRASMERKIRMSESRYRGLFEAGLAAAFLVDKSGRIFESNNAFARLAPGVVVIGGLFHDETAAKSLVDAIGAGSVFGPMRIQVHTEDGRESWALLIAAPMDLPDGSSAYQCQAIDITERKTLLDQLVHAQKLSALGRFAGGVAHDFNNVLTAVLGYASLLRSDLEAEGRGLEEVEGIEQAARRAAALARQLLMFSRRDTTEASVFSLSGLVHDIEKMLRRIIGDGALLTVRTESGLDLVLADKSRMEQAVVNLVTNARDAMPSGGRIVVTTGAMHMDDGSIAEADPPFADAPAGDWSFVEVLDEGTGIAPEIVQKVFEPFFTTKAPDKGTGLGLSTVANIVRQAEGHIRLSSTPGEGTTVRLLFPMAHGGTAEGKAPTESSDGRASHERGQASRLTVDFPGKGRTVLVVENDSSVLTILEALLDKAGYRVIAAGHPGEALLLAENAGSLPDLLVADMAMPLMTGLELAARLRGSVPGMPALFLRSRDGNPSEDAVSGAMTSLESCIDKPFTEEDLLGALDALLRNQN